MATPVRRSFSVSSAMAAILSMAACSNNSPIGYHPQDGSAGGGEVGGPPDAPVAVDAPITVDAPVAVDASDTPVVADAPAAVDMVEATVAVDVADRPDSGPGCSAARSIFMNKCMACHSAATKNTFGGFDLETEPLAQRLIGVLSPGASVTSQCGGKGPYLVAGSSPATGLLLDKIGQSPPCGVRMPQIGRLTAAEIACIQLWADQLVAWVGGSSYAGVNYETGATD